MNTIKKKYAKILSLVVCGALACGGVATFSYALGNNSTDNISSKTASTDEKTDDSEKALSKDETVYVLAGADGSVKKVIVSDWIKNALNKASINDKSELQDVENVKGDESYAMNGDNMRVWDAQGNDIYYKGNISKELPVNIAISYKLDGKSVSPSEIAGKSGKVTIRFDYKNNQYENVNIDGKEEKINVPFAMITGTILNNNNFRNVTVTNGKLINDGDKTIVAGISLPGLQENLNMDKEKLEIPDYIEITADATDFKMSTTMTVATNEVFNKVDISKVGSLDELTSKTGELTDAMKQLMDGSSKLYDGLSELLNKSGELIDGINQLAAGSDTLRDGTVALNDGSVQIDNGVAQLKDGSVQLKDGTAQLSDSIPELTDGVNQLNDGSQKLVDGTSKLTSGVGQLSEGAQKISVGLGKLKGNNDALNGGAKEVFENLLATVDSQISASGLTAEKLTISNYKTVLNDLIASLSEENIKKAGAAKVEAAVRANTAQVTAGVTAVVKTNVEAQVKSNEAAIYEGVLQAVGQPMTYDQYKAAVSAGLVSETQQQQIDAAVKQQEEKLVNDNMASDTVKATIASETEKKIQSLITENITSDDTQQQLATAIAQAKAGASSLDGAKKQLEKYNEFYDGLNEYTAGVASASDGASELSGKIPELTDGVNSLDDGAKQLHGGIVTLKDKTSSLIDGGPKLKDGAAELYNGVLKLKDATGSLVDGSAQVKDGAALLNDGLTKLKDSTGALKDGVTQLKDGSMSLCDGLKQLNDQGIKKLVDAVDGDVKGLVTRIKATADVSKDYKSFSGISDEMDGSVKFIYKTDEIK